MVLFPETAVTRLVTTDDPTDDLPRGTPIPGPVTGRFSELAQSRDLWLGLGLIERAARRLYDTAILIDARGQIALKYRRVNPNWHGRDADPDVYREGIAFPVTWTPSGRTMVLICGDLWDDAFVQSARTARPDYCCIRLRDRLGPAAQEQWDHAEMAAYAEPIRLVGCPALMVNYLSEPALSGWSAGCFGGAWLVTGDSPVACQLPVGNPGVLMAEI